jgi:hypothetical protein
LWARLTAVLGEHYVTVWADTQALSGLDGRTVREALAAGLDCKRIWRAAWLTLELPARER